MYENHITVVEGYTDEDAQWVCVCGAGEEAASLAEAGRDSRLHEREA